MYGKDATSPKTTNTQGHCPSKPTEYTICGARFTKNCKSTMPSLGILLIWASEHWNGGTIFCENWKITRPSSWLSILLREDQHVMIVFPGCVAKHYICFSFGAWERYNKTESQSIYRGTVHPSTGRPRCGTGFGEYCETTMPSSGWCILLHEERQAINMLIPIPHILWVHCQDHTSLGHNQYTSILFI